MSLRKLVLFRFIRGLVFILSVLTPAIKCQIQGCSIQGLDLGLCLNQTSSSLSMNSGCCEMLNKVIRIGYNCLCLLAASSLPSLSTPIILISLSNCFISVPPLAHCRAPVPILFPPNIPDDITQPSMPPKDVCVSPPLSEMQAKLNSTREDNSTVVPVQPFSSRENVSPKSSPPKENETSNGRGKTDMILLILLLLSLVLYGFMILA